MIQSPYRVLLVDDDPLVLDGMRPVLERQGHHVITASSGEEALHWLAQGMVHVVVTDLVMAGMDGIEVLKRVRRDWPGTLVLILTGHGDLGSAIEALRLKADDYLLKPCLPEELTYRVEKALRQWEMGRRVRLYEKILPVCMYCKKIRDDSETDPGQGPWLQLEEYLRRRAGVLVSHSCCPGCERQQLAQLEEELKRQ